MPRPKKMKTAKIPIKKVISSKDKTEKREIKITRLLGMKDALGPDYKYFNLVCDKARELAKVYGFSPIKIPILENFDLYKKSTRKNSDKEFYFLEGDKTNRIVLRPEMTQGIARAYLENNLEEGLSMARFFALGPIFRQEKFQTGHYRESTQFNLEVIGEDKAMAEALLIVLANNFFKELNIKAQVQINSLCDVNCRKEYCHKLLSFYRERGRRSHLCSECKKNINKNCLGLLDCKNDACIKEKMEAPQIADYLSTESRDHFTKVLEYLDELGVEYNFNPYLVRGLSYYNDTVFEFWPLNEGGNIIGKLALGGGGRYDTYIDALSNQEVTAAVGLAIGIERTVTRLKDKPSLIKNKEKDIIFISHLGEQAKIKSLQLFEELRGLGFNVRQSFLTNSLRKQLEEATEMGVKTNLILGKKEIMDETILMRDMESGAQEVVVFKKIKERLEKIKVKFNDRKGGGLSG